MGVVCAGCAQIPTGKNLVSLSVPRRFRSAKALYCASIKEKIKASDRGVAANDLNSLPDQAWEKLSHLDKTEWEKRSEEDEKRWISEMEQYQAATKTSDEEFTDAALYAVLDKCFIKDTLNWLLDRCIATDDSAFASLMRTKARPKRERLTILCKCRPQQCQNAASLFRYLVQVQ